MYQPMLFVHWKQARLILIPFVLASFALPLMLVQGLAPAAPGDEVTMQAYRIVADFQLWLPMFPLLALGIGTMLALTAWNWDHQLGHVYALSLPLARWEYTMLKMGAGAVIALVPAAALWLGAQLAVASVALPEGLVGYPNQLAFRFFLATLLSYALFFAMAAGTIKTTIWVVTGVIVFLVAGEFAQSVINSYIGAPTDFSVVGVVLNWLVRAPGPFEVFFGNWSLIDV